MDEVFRALADPSRRRLLDSLNAKDGQTLRELCAGLDMARQSVSKHLAVLEAAHLVTTVWRGREKLHFLDAEPVNAVAERWINQYHRARVRALADPAGDRAGAGGGTLLTAAPRRAAGGEGTAMGDGTAGPLRGVRVVELAGIGPGPYCAMLLADLGADVVRVERPGQGPDAAGPVTMRGRHRLVLDLKQARDLDTLRALIDKADVFIEPYRPGVTERLGIGPDECLARNPRLVYGRMTGWGQDGPWAGMAGHDIAYIAITGVLHTATRAGAPPQPPANLLGDFAGGSMFLLTGVLAALLERERSGRGQVVDAAIVDGATSLAAYLLGLRAAGRWVDTAGENLLDTGAPFYDVYETADGKWLAVGALEPKFYAELVRLLELADLPPQYEVARWPELRGRLAARIRQRTRDEWAEVFAGSDACVAPVLNFPEAARHPHLAARGTLTERDGVLQPAAAPRFSRTPPGPVGEPPGPAELAALLAGWGVPVDESTLGGSAGEQRTG